MGRRATIEASSVMYLSTHTQVMGLATPVALVGLSFIGNMS